MTDEPRRRYVKPRELLAIRADYVQQDDRGAFFWLFGPSVSKNERLGDGRAMVVRIEGPLEYHDDSWGESYESIYKRTALAMKGKTYDDDAGSGAPECVLYRINSPGGVVAGLDQSVRKTQKLSKDEGIPIISVVDEQAYSAGCAVCCAGKEIYLPKSGFIGSVGVISTMVDVTEADRKAGYRFVVLTSGARKADGHPHVAITDDMIDEETPRVAALAKQFYQLVKQRTGVPIKTIQGWQAKRFLGSEARRAGLVDGVKSWSQFVEEYSKPSKTAVSVPSVAPGGTSVSDSTLTEANMPRLEAIIARKEAAIKAEMAKSKPDYSAIATLGADLEAAKKTKKMEEEEEEATKSEEDEEATKCEEDEEASAAAARLEAATHGARKSKGDETDRSDDEDDDEDDEDEDDDDAKKGKKSKKASSGASDALAAVQQMTGEMNPKRAIAALQGKIAGADAVKQDVARINAERLDEKKASAIDSALSARRITPAEAKDLRTKEAAFVTEYLKMRPKALVQSASDSDGQITAAGGGATPEAQGAIDAFIARAVANGAKVTRAQVDEKLAQRAANGSPNGTVTR